MFALQFHLLASELSQAPCATPKVTERHHAFTSSVSRPSNPQRTQKVCGSAVPSRDSTINVPLALSQGLSVSLSLSLSVGQRQSPDGCFCPGAHAPDCCEALAEFGGNGSSSGLRGVQRSYRFGCLLQTWRPLPALACHDWSIFPNRS